MHKKLETLAENSMSICTIAITGIILVIFTFCVVALAIVIYKLVA